MELHDMIGPMPPQMLTTVQDPEIRSATSATGVAEVLASRVRNNLGRPFRVKRLERADLRTAQEIADALVQLTGMYPGVRFRVFKLSRGGSPEGGFARVHPWTRTMVFNGALARPEGRPRLLARLHRSEWAHGLVKGGVKGTITHEFGHLMQARARRLLDIRKWRRFTPRAALRQKDLLPMIGHAYGAGSDREERVRLGEDQTVNDLSAYALDETRTRGRQYELGAEAFAQMHFAPVPSRAARVAYWEIIRGYVRATRGDLTARPRFNPERRGQWTDAPIPGRPRRPLYVPALPPQYADHQWERRGHLGERAVPPPWADNEIPATVDHHQTAAIAKTMRPVRFLRSRWGRTTRGPSAGQQLAGGVQQHHRSETWRGR